MNHLSYTLFPEFQHLISETLLKNNLKLVSSIVNFSKGNLLDQNKINLILEKLGQKMKGTRLYPGGRSVLFAWSFPFPKIDSILIKPYYSCEIMQLILHYLSMPDFLDTVKSLERSTNRMIRITIPKVIGIAKIDTLNRNFPALIMEEVKGESIKGDFPAIREVSKIVRDLARNGIICDPYPSNWKYLSKKQQSVISYIDLISSNSLTNVTTRIAELLSSMK
jgi:hypothetical protein